MTDEIKTPKGANVDNNMYNLIDYLITKKMSFLNTFKLCKVVAVNDDKTIDVKNMILEQDANGQEIESVIWKRLPKLQTQGSKAAFIIEYKVDDIVLCGFCDRDYWAVRRNGKQETAPLHPTITPLSSGVVLGAVLFDEASKYIKITDDGIEIVGDVSITGDLSVSGDLSADGKIVSGGAMEAGNGATGTFVDTGQGASGKTLTITKGIITQVE
jgi:hypothetical protein